MSSRRRAFIDVYCCTSPTGKRYVGVASTGVKDRWFKHISEARRRSNTAFHKAIRKYGSGAFTVAVLERMTTWAGAMRAEQLWIRLLRSFGPEGYNLTIGGDGTLGRKHSQVELAKMAKSREERKLSPEHVRKMADRRRGQRMSDENKAKLIACNTGRKVSIETRARMSAGQKGRRATNETRAKMRESAQIAWLERRKRGAS